MQSDKANMYVLEAQRWYEQGLHTDFELTAECGAKIRLHKLVISAGSSYFRTLLGNSEIVECKTCSVNFAQFSAPVLKNIVHYIYYDRLEDSTEGEDYLDLLECADYLGVQGAVHDCSQHIIQQQLSVNNWLDFSSLFLARCLAGPLSRVMSYARDRFEEIIKQKYDEPWKTELLMDVWGRSEYELFFYLVDWAEEYGLSLIHI